MGSDSKEDSISSDEAIAGIEMLSSESIELIVGGLSFESDESTIIGIGSIRCPGLTIGLRLGLVIAVDLGLV